MALNFPSSPISGQTYTDSNGVIWEYNSTKTVWAVKRYDELKEFSGAKLNLTTSEVLTLTSTAITWDAADFDTGNYFNLSSYPSRLIIPRTGYYRINVLLNTGPQGNGASYTFTVKQNASTVFTTDTAGPNQGIHYDEIHLLFSGDYIEIYGEESSAVGTVLTNSYFEIERVGYSLGSAFSSRNAFSGVKLLLTTAENATVTPTPVTWDTTEFNINADVNGSVYWNISNSDKITIYTTGYYRLKSTFETSTAGSNNSYTVDLKLNGSTLESSSLGANETLDLDETYNFTSGSYLQLYFDNTGSVGQLTTDSYFELIRVGV
jgi:hypothetical protein